MVSENALLHDRLGTILLERGRYSEAEPLVQLAAQRLEQALGPDNPVRGEAAFASALSSIFQLLPFQVRAGYVVCVLHKVARQTTSF